MRRLAFPLVALLVTRVVLSPLEARGENFWVSPAEEESTAMSTVSSKAYAVAVFVVALVVFIVVMEGKGRVPRPDDGVGWAPGDVGDALVSRGMYGGRGALALMLAGLVESPAAMDALTREAAAGRGAGLDALARAAGVPAGEVARRWLDAASAPAPTRAEALVGVVRFVEAIGPRMAPDPEAAAELVEALSAERSHPERARPAHAAVAAWTGVPEGAVAEVVGEVLGEGGPEAASQRVARRAGAVDAVHRLGARLGETHPEEVAATARELVAHGAALGVGGGKAP